MTTHDRERWDAKHRAAWDSPVGRPEAFLAEVLPTVREALVEAGRTQPVALDLACGSGRNALLLLREGFQVIGVDVSPAALELLEQRALAEGLEVTTRAVDLEPAPPPGRAGRPAEAEHDEAAAREVVEEAAKAAAGESAKEAVAGPEREAAATTALVEAIDGEGRLDVVVVVNYLARELFAVIPRLLRPGGFLVWSTMTVDRVDGPPARFRLDRGELDGAFPSLATVCSVERDGRASILARRPLS